MQGKEDFRALDHDLVQALEHRRWAEPIEPAVKYRQASEQQDVHPVTHVPGRVCQVRSQQYQGRDAEDHEVGSNYASPHRTIGCVAHMPNNERLPQDQRTIQPNDHVSQLHLWVIWIPAQEGAMPPLPQEQSKKMRKKDGQRPTHSCDDRVHQKQQVQTPLLVEW
eukprot:CAMPEP_0203998246 /NCGR_PEP_ID=MMETSP0360-20130528/13943_1 /ASSEMBLY_ACC=CAM_ASM_000342 /TAXON_ID=268821 /ORGANISM="Scrippsiella Hangoei, Strain SHTV-5" /LENGTH=164 /DNA_ID=CAMNT_0050939297 /DNA_START=146 /DNA_END=638 /DNA_ORIENTATION=-